MKIISRNYLSSVLRGTGNDKDRLVVGGDVCRCFDVTMKKAVLKEKGK
jgi:hypothetical protein